MSRLATIRVADGTRAVALVSTPEGDRHLDLGFSSLREYFEAGSPARPIDGTLYDVDHADFAPVVPDPSKIICVGHNYSDHIAEMGRDLPEHPVLFAKFAETLTGAYDDISKPAETDAFDWEVELAVVIGTQVRRASGNEAAAAIAGFTVMNDISVRDWQFRTVEWTQGKVWESTTPVGPYVVTPDELGGVRPALQVQTIVDDQVMQDDNTGTLVFTPDFLVEYISTMVTLNPGDIIATGTPGGVGHAREPRVYLAGGQQVQAVVEGLGACINTIVES